MDINTACLSIRADSTTLYAPQSYETTNNKLHIRYVCVLLRVFVSYLRAASFPGRKHDLDTIYSRNSVINLNLLILGHI
jgi:hypothetical protein